jgi:ABC-2 type transport system ATP-binding protein
MRILTGFLPPTDGTAAIDGHDIFSQPLAARRAIGYLPESPPVYPEMSVEDFLGYVAKLKDVPRRSRAGAVDRALERCGLEDVRRRVIGALSKGYRQRVGLAQAIVHDPPVLILDEPTVGLDPIQIREIRGLIAELASAREGRPRTVILSTHILTEVEAICRRVILIHRGRKALDAPLDEVKRGGATLEEVFARTTAREEHPEVHASEAAASTMEASP